MTFPKTETLRVSAKHADRPCPRMGMRRSIDKSTGRDRRLIHADEVVDVPNERYYRRRIVAGDLVLMTGTPLRGAPEKPNEKGAEKAKG